MFDRFTERARRVMTLARQEAQALNNDYIGTEHILLGLTAEGHGVASQVLKNLGLDLETVRGEMERLVERGESPAKGTQLPFTPRAKRVLELALEEAQSLGHNYIGTEHLLLGLIRERDGPAARALENLRVTSEEVREEVLQLLSGEGPSEPRKSEAAALDEALAAHVDSLFPRGGVYAGAGFRRTGLGRGFHVVVQWRPDPAKPPRASVSVVSEDIETLRERIPQVLDVLAGLIAKEKAEPGGEGG